MSDAYDFATFQRSSTTTVTDPVSPFLIGLAGLSFLIFAIILFYVLVAVWPVLNDVSANSKIRDFKEFKLFGLWCRLEPDRQVLVMVMAAGALGSLTHVLTSFADFVGNKKLGISWTWWFILRVPIGVALAVLLYFVVRGGLIVPNVETQASQAGGAQHDVTLKLNFYSIAAFSALAGMFSKQATDKFGEVFTAIFAMKNEVQRAGALDAGGLTVSPTQLVVGQPKPLTITGKELSDKTTASIGGSPRSFVPGSGGTQGAVTIEAQDVAEPRTFDLVVTNNGKTYTIPIKVTAAASADPLPAAPEISSTIPERLTAASPRTLDVIGKGLTKCEVEINGERRDFTPADDNKVTVILIEKDFENIPGSLALVVKGANGTATERKIDLVA